MLRFNIWYCFEGKCKHSNTPKYHPTPVPWLRHPGGVLVFFGQIVWGFKALCKDREPLKCMSTMPQLCHTQLSKLPQQGKLWPRWHLISPAFLLPLSDQFSLALSTNTPQKKLKLPSTMAQHSCSEVPGTTCTLSPAYSHKPPDSPPASLSSARPTWSWLKLTPHQAFPSPPAFKAPLSPTTLTLPRCAINPALPGWGSSPHKSPLSQVWPEKFRCCPKYSHFKLSF